MRKYIAIVLLAVGGLAACGEDHVHVGIEDEREVPSYSDMAWELKDTICDELYSYNIHSDYEFSLVEAEYWYNFGIAFESTSGGISFGPEVRRAVEPVIASCW